MKKYQKYLNSGVGWLGEIPDTWVPTKLKYVGFLYGGLTGKTSEDFKNEEDSNNKFYITFTNICNNVYVSKGDLGQVRVFGGEKQNQVEIGDLFFLMSSESQEDVGKSSVLKDNIGEVYLNSFCKGFRILNDLVNPLFLNYLLHGKDYRDLMSIHGNGFTRINLRQDKVNDFVFFYPTYEEQIQIVTFLDQKTSIIDDLIQKKLQKIELLKEQRTSIINQVVTKGLNPEAGMKETEVEWIGDMPNHWVIEKLKYCAEITYGISPNESSYNDFGDGIELINGPVEYSEEDFGYTRSLKWTTDPKKFASKGSLLFCLRGSTTGRMNITHKDVAIGRGVCAINPRGSFGYSLYCIIMIRSYIQELISGSTFPSVTKDDVDNFQLPYPPIPEQHQIVAYLDKKTSEIDKQIIFENRKIDLLKEYRQSLISEVVTGKIDLRTN